MRKTLVNWMPHVMERLPDLWEAVADTLLMVLWSGAVSFLLGMLLGVLLLLGKVGKIVVKHAEDLQEKDVDLQLVIRRLFQGQAVDVLDPAKDFLMPRHMLFKLQ